MINKRNVLINSKAIVRESFDVSVDLNPIHDANTSGFSTLHS